MILIHDPRSAEYSAPGHPERPERITETVSLLRTRHSNWKWRLPQPADESAILRAHTPQHLARIRNAASAFDPDTPAYPGIYDHAARAVGAAIDAAHAALQGDPAFSLMRPPGHHATRSRAMGFCYLSNIAIAALEVTARESDPEPQHPSTGAIKGKTRTSRVGIWDFDAHHGNGTEDIVLSHPGILFTSIHQFPGYPGTGTRSFGNIYNFPLAPLESRKKHMEAVREALDLLIAFEPDLLLVSAGFDAYLHDPLTEMTLEPEDFATMGQWLRKAGIPAAAILEGGYSNDLPKLVDLFLSAWSGEEK